MNDNSPAVELKKRMSRVCDGGATASDLEAVEGLLAKHPELIDLYTAFVANEAALDVICGKATLDLPTTEAAHRVAPTVDRRRGTSVAPPIASRGGNRRSFTFRRQIGRWFPYAVSAAVVLGFAMWWVGRPGAVLVASDDAVWADGQNREIGVAIGNEWLELAQGSVNLAFRSGAQAVLHAPASFRVADFNSCELAKGALSAQVPPAARGYSVVTPDLTIVDLGTSFRVNVGDQGRMSCHVTDGKVKLDRRGTAQPIGLSAGKVARIDRSGAEIAILERALVDATGNIRFVAEHPPSLGYNAYDRDDLISVFLETQNVQLSEDVRVNINQPGRHTQLNSVRGKIAAGTTVDCYLVHCAPQRKRHIVEGQIVFPGRIVGLICDSDLLNSTNNVLGASWTLKCQHNERGLESVPDRNSDVVILSDNQRTLGLRMRTESIDQLRVLVESN